MKLYKWPKKFQTFQKVLDSIKNRTRKSIYDNLTDPTRTILNGGGIVQLVLFKYSI